MNQSVPVIKIQYAGVVIVLYSELYRHHGL